VALGGGHHGGTALRFVGRGDVDAIGQIGEDVAARGVQRDVVAPGIVLPDHRIVVDIGAAVDQHHLVGHRAGHQRHVVGRAGRVVGADGAPDFAVPDGVAQGVAVVPYHHRAVALRFVGDREAQPRVVAAGDQRATADAVP